MHGETTLFKVHLPVQPGLGIEVLELLKERLLHLKLFRVWDLVVS